jgi:hypothetical protein
MAYEIFWADLASVPNYSGFEQCPTVEMAVEFARTRLLFSSPDSFAIISDTEVKNIQDARTHRLHWIGSEIVCYERDSVNWSKPRVRP